VLAVDEHAVAGGCKDELGVDVAAVHRKTTTAESLDQRGHLVVALFLPEDFYLVDSARPCDYCIVLEVAASRVDYANSAV
jgi:hypothetical protein